MFSLDSNVLVLISEVEVTVFLEYCLGAKLISGLARSLIRNIIVKMSDICNLIGHNSVHISDFFYFYRANIKGMYST